MTAADTSIEDAPSRFRRFAWPLGVLAILISATTATLVFLNRSKIGSVDQANPIETTLPIGFALVGAVLASRRPRNPVGWIFLGIAIFGALPGVSTQYVFRSAHFHRLPGVRWVAWTYDWMVWLVFPAGLATFLFLLFPDGRFQSRRWRFFGWVVAVELLFGLVLNMLAPTIELTGSPPVDNPIGVSGIDLGGLLGLLVWPVGVAMVVTAMVGLIMRMRRATGDARQQLRALAYASAVTAILLVAVIVGFIVDPHLSNAWFDLVIVLGFGVSIPVACGVAILKYGLYELDVVVSKAVVYAVLAAFFTAVYVALVVGVGTAIGSTRNPFLTVAAAALIALAFNPVREQAKRLANHLVYGKRATPYEVLSEFADRMAGTYSLDEVLPRTVRILGEGTGARSATVWLRIGDELRPAAQWGEADPAARAVPALNGELPAMPSASRVVAVRHQGDLLGALTLTKAPGEPLTAAEAKLVHDLAAQAGLVLSNVRLTEELRANLDELRASRQRIVAAQDGARRRLERDIHDGAQQQLVALSVKLRLVDGLVGRDDERAHAMLDQLRTEAQDALENLRDLARGIYPPLLADQGLAAALESQARKSTVPVAVEAEGVGRYPQDVEAAVYFCILEALQNVAKYAGASRVLVVIRPRPESVAFEVNDDGRGFDPGSAPRGSGLLGMADRLAALGGDLTIESAPGAGTTIRGSVPVADEGPR